MLKSAGPFLLPPLPYDEGALAPAISARTLKVHHGKHHATYIEKTNELVDGTNFASMSLEEIVKETAGKAAEKQLYHNAAQAWNHTFYWNSLAPKASKPSTALQAAIARDFTNFAELNAALMQKATDHFASGWVWLVVKDKKLAVVDTSDGDTPMAENTPCLLAIDVWEHAYYLDYQNDRKAHVTAVVKNLLNWEFAAANFEKL